MSIEEQIKILELYREGAAIEWTWTIRKRSDTWTPITNGKFNFADKIYRKKAS